MRLIQSHRKRRAASTTGIQIDPDAGIFVPALEELFHHFSCFVCYGKHMVLPFRYVLFKNNNDDVKVNFLRRRQGEKLCGP